MYLVIVSLKTQDQAHPYLYYLKEWEWLLRDFVLFCFGAGSHHAQTNLELCSPGSHDVTTILLLSLLSVGIMLVSQHTRLKSSFIYLSYILVF